MGHNAEIFISSFNRIEKWMREHLNNPKNIGFTELVHRSSRRKDSPVAQFEEDLLQMAQLRNAIVHERIASDFVIAEPNDWAVERIETIEHALMQPEKVFPRFAKRVTGFEHDLPLLELLRIVSEKRYSQFPLYNKGHFEGLITLRALGYWFAVESAKKRIRLENRTAQDLLMENGKVTNYRFVSSDTTVFDVERLFHEYATLEAVLITKDGNPDGQLVGIVRPRDIYSKEKE
ncbi:MAG: CBS domain-containing protein [Enterococcus sp.]